MARTGSAGFLLRSAGLIAGVTLLARAAGFVRYLVFGTSIGGGAIGTAYTSANLLPNILFEVVAGGALAGVAIPLLAGPLAHRDEDEVNRIVSSLLTWALAVLVPLAVLVVVAAEPLASGFLGWNGGDDNAAQIALGASLLRAFAWQLPLYGISVVLGAYLQAKRRFLWPALMPLVSSLVVMVTYRLFAFAASGTTLPGLLPFWARFWLGWGTTAGVVALSLPLIIPAWRAGLHFRPRLGFPEGMAARASKLGASAITAVAAQQAANLAILLLAMRAGGDGTLPVYQYAQAVYLLPYAILVMPLISSGFPQLARLRHLGRVRELGELVASSQRTVIGLGVIGACVLWSAAPAVEVFFRMIDREHVTGVGPSLGALAIGLAGYALMMQQTRILYALERTRDAIVVGTVGWAVAIVLICWLVLFSPQRSAAAASVVFGLSISIGMIAAAVVGLVRLSDLLEARARRVLGRDGGISVVIAIVAAFAGHYVCRVIVPSAGNIWLAPLAGLAGGAVALIVSAGGIRLLCPEVLTGLARLADDGLDDQPAGSDEPDEPDGKAGDSADPRPERGPGTP